MCKFFFWQSFVPFEKIGKQISPNPLIPKDGYISLDETPGLGVELDEEKLSKFSYSEFPRTLPYPDNEGFHGGAWPDNLDAL